MMDSCYLVLANGKLHVSRSGNFNILASMPCIYKFFRDVNFMVFTVNWSFVKFSSSKLHWQNFGLHQLESRIHMDDYI